MIVKASTVGSLIPIATAGFLVVFIKRQMIHNNFIEKNRNATFQWKTQLHCASQETIRRTLSFRFRRARAA